MVSASKFESLPGQKCSYLYKLANKVARPRWGLLENVSSKEEMYFANLNNTARIQISDHFPKIGNFYRPIRIMWLSIPSVLTKARLDREI